MHRRNLGYEEDYVWILASELIDDEAVSAENARQRIPAPHVVGAVLHEHDVRFLPGPALKLCQSSVARLRWIIGEQISYVISAMTLRHQVGSSSPTALVVEVHPDEVEIRVSFRNQFFREELRVTGVARNRIAERHHVPHPGVRRRSRAASRAGTSAATSGAGAPRAS